MRATWLCLVYLGCGTEPVSWSEHPPVDDWPDLSIAPFTTGLASDAGTESTDAAAPPIERPGEIDIKIGQAAQGSELDADALGDVRSVADRWADFDSERHRIGQAIHLMMDFPYQSWAGEGSWVHLVALDTELQPIDGAEVFLDRELIGRTEEHGTLVFRKRPELEASSQSHILTVRHLEKVRTVSFSSYARTQSFEATTVYAYTDRGVYQPGRTIHLRALAWRLRGEYRARANHELSVELQGPDGQLVGGGSARTNDWGVALLDLPLPLHAPEGTYKLVVSSGGEQMESRIQVRRFVAPVIRIEHDLPRFLTPAVQNLPFELRLAYVDGGTFEQANIDIVLKVDGHDAAELQRHVTGIGPHRFQIDEAALEIVRRMARRNRRATPAVKVEVRVRDALGAEERLVRDIRYEDNPYKATIELDKTRYATGDPVAAMVRLVDLDDVPVRGSLIKLVLPGGRRLQMNTDDSGVALFRFNMPRNGGGEEIWASTADVEDLVSATLPSGAPLPMRSSVEDTVIPEGEMIDVLVRFPLDVVPHEEVVHADVVDSSGAIVDSFLIPVDRSGPVPTARTQVSATSWGSMLLTLFSLGRRGNDIGLLSDGQNLVVQPGKTLEITLNGLPESAAPSDVIEADVLVTRNGEPTDAIIGASIVDSAVLALLDPFERAPTDRFYNPERKVLASTGAQTLTWPVVARTWGADRYDIGWPPRFGYHDGKPPAAPPGRWRAPTDVNNGLLQGGTGSSFGFGGLGLSGTGMGGGGTGEGTIGLGNLGTIGHGGGGGTGSGYGRGAGGLRGRSHRRRVPRRPPPTRIILRTDFAETSLWAPTLHTDGGRMHLESELPDAITEQQLMLLASDRNGGIALRRATIPVRQDVQVRASMPATLSVGDVVEVPVVVRNRGSRTVEATVEFASDDLDIRGGAQSVEVAAHEATAVKFTVQAQRAGSITVRAQARVGETLDVEQRQVQVRPRGVPTRRYARGIASAGEEMRTEVHIAGDGYDIVRLGITMPNGVPIVQGALEFAQRPVGPDAAASHGLALAAAWTYLKRTEQLSAAAERELSTRLNEIAMALVSGQHSDGGFGWRFASGHRASGQPASGQEPPRSSPYVSISVLEALIELQDAGAMVPRLRAAECESLCTRAGGSQRFGRCGRHRNLAG